MITYNELTIDDIYVNNSSRLRYRVLWFNEDVVFIVANHKSAYPLQVPRYLFNEHYEKVETPEERM